MTLPETADNSGKTKESLAAQNKLVDEQRQKVEGLKSEIAGYQQMLASPGPSINGYLINHLISQEDAVKSLDFLTLLINQFILCSQGFFGFPRII